LERLTILLLTLVLARLSAQDIESLPEYRPDQTVSGDIRIWGTAAMLSITKYWGQDFRKHQPNVSLDSNLMGTGTAMAGLYTGVADVALMGRAATPKEIMAFEWVFQHKPLAIEVMTGGLESVDKSPALVVFAHRDNPISSITLAQLDAIFGCEHLRGLSAIRTWGQLGLKGEWADTSIHAYGYDAETGTGSFFQQLVLKGSRKWNWEIIKEFPDSQQIIEALSGDRSGIAISSQHYLSPQVKRLAVARDDGSPYFEPTRENVVKRRYPLTRSIFIYINRAPGKPLDPKLKEFLRFVLSQAGQGAVLRDGGYLPLTAEIIRGQRNKLE
jgi:phosphate transport system substrate-binding protein